MSEGRRRRVALVRGRGPQRTPARLLSDEEVPEVAPEQAEFPELVGDVFPDVGDDAVRSDDDLFARVRRIDVFGSAREPGRRIPGRHGRGVGRRRRAFVLFFNPHHPAALQSPLVLQEDGVLRFQNVERGRPEVQSQNVALVGEQVVLDVEPGHRLEMCPHDALDDDRPDRGGVVAAVLEILQRGSANRQTRAIALVPFGHARIQVPAVIVEPRGFSDAPDVVERPVLDLAKPDDDVRYLHAGIVDVVLHLDRCLAEAEHPCERVAKRCVPQVADVRRLVGIDGRVLDDRFLLARAERRDVAAQPCEQKRRAIQVQVEIPVWRRDQARDAWNGANCGGQLLCDHARRLSQSARKLERGRDRQIAQGAVRRHLDGKRRHALDAVLPPNSLG